MSNIENPMIAAQERWMNEDEPVQQEPQEIICHTTFGVNFWIRKRDGQLCVCAWCCGKLPNGEWNHELKDKATRFLEQGFNQKASHGICPQCVEEGRL